MAKRLSSIFSLSKDDNDPQTFDGHDDIGQHLPKSPSSHKLHKHLSPLPDSMTAQAGIHPLAPPPLLTDIDPTRYSSRNSAGSSRPGSRTNSRPNSRPTSRNTSPVSAGTGSRPQTPTLLMPHDGTSSPRPTTPNSAKLNKRRSWLPGKTEKHKQGDGFGGPTAWIAGLHHHEPYDLNPLLRGEPVWDLWNQNGDTFVHLYPQVTGKGPTFKMDSALFIDSIPLLQLRAQMPNIANGSTSNLQTMQSQFSNMSMYETPQSNRVSVNFSVPGGVPTIKGEKHIYIPLELENPLAASPELDSDDQELIILYRNFFAFLAGGALVASPRQTSLYQIFMSISSVLTRFQFSDPEGSSFGDVASNSFTRYCDELKLADVRSSREKTIEAIVLGEQMKSWLLYNEGFVHAAGRLDDVKSIKSPKFTKISPTTINRLERASLDVQQRLMIVREKLQDFEFPSMFAGIANSQTSTEGRLVRFKEWRLAFLDFRRFTMSYYKRKYGAWPPKASSKKNNFEESGLNRLLLSELYNDFTDLYDMLVDRTSLTPRTVDMPVVPDIARRKNVVETTQYTMRRVESEYDRATPPVIPPIPYDVPIIPMFEHSFNKADAGLAHKTMASKRLKENDANNLLLGSYNRESMKGSSFIQDFLAYERKLVQGKTIDEVIDARCGQWLFMYAVLQSLPMTVVDARGVSFTEGVEYFVCIAPRGGRPWMREDTSQSRDWYTIASANGTISLPADVIDHSVEGIYRRSHCWLISVKWAQESGAISPQAQYVPLIDTALQPPPFLAGASPLLSASSAGARSSGGRSPAVSPMLQPVSPAFAEGNISRNSSATNLALGAGIMSATERPARPVSTYNPDITFDAILGAKEKPGKKDKKR